MKANDSITDGMWVRWQQESVQLRQKVDYQSNSLVKFFNLAGHGIVERGHDHSQHFSKVLEIGAGTGDHIAFVKHTYDEYFATDFNKEAVRIGSQNHQGSGKIHFEVQDALVLQYPDSHFDRLISIYTLEHLPQPHVALSEWKRVLKKGGQIDIVIPTEGGIAWNLGRHLTTRRQYKKLGFDLDYIIAREHINACYRLVAIIRHYFKLERESWFPFKVPTPHLNLLYHCRAKI